jgi:wyosine [tRNA(Phe)-imidazoG37] synthetase (radical SAM superfamily)
VAEILSSLEQALKNLPQPVNYITFSGNGEATLHPGFRELVEGVRELRDRLSPSAKTAILSNSTTVKDPRTREALTMLDVRIMKLDSGTQEMFAHYNQPADGFTLQETVEGLALLEDVTLQSLFTKGPDGNFFSDHLAAWIEQVKKIAPVFVQVYSLARKSPTQTLFPLEKEELLQVLALLEREKIPAGFF